MAKSLRQRRLSFRLTIVLLFVVVAGCLVAVALSSHYLLTREIAEDNAEQHFVETARQAANEAVALEESGINLAFALQHHPAVREPIDERTNSDNVASMLAMLQRHAGVFMLYVGYPNGDYLEVADLEAAKGLRDAWDAAPDDRWVVTRVLASDGQRLTDFLDDRANLRLRRSEATDYDATTRPWYRNANEQRVNLVAPYLFRFIQMPGTSYTLRTAAGQVVGSSTLTASLQRALLPRAYPKSGRAFLFDEEGTVRAYAEPQADAHQRAVKRLSLTDDESAWLEQHPRITVANLVDYPPLEYSVGGEPRGFSVELLQMLADSIGIELELINGLNFNELMRHYEQGRVDLMLSMFQTDQRSRQGVFSRTTTQTPIVAAVRGDAESVTDVDDLRTRRIALQQRYAVSERLSVMFPDADFVKVDNTLDALTAISEGRADVALDVAPVMDYLTRYFRFEDIRLSNPLPFFADDERYAFHFYAPTEQETLIKLLDRAYQELPEKQLAMLHEYWLGDPPGYAQTSPAQTGQVADDKLLSIAGEPERHGQLRKVTIDDQTFFGFVQPIQCLADDRRQEYIGLLVSDGEVVEPYLALVKRSTILLLILLVLASLLIALVVRVVLRPIYRLIDQNSNLLDQRLSAVEYVPSRIEELHQLSRSIVEMKRTQIALHEAERFLANTLDALSAHVAILDAEGTILAVNDRWRGLVEADAPMDVPVCEEGKNYLQVCDAAANADAQAASTLAAGVRDVIAGRRDQFTMEYSCHSPSQRCWFTGQVTRFAGADPVRVVVAHEEITERRQLEAQLMVAERMASMGMLAAGVAHEINNPLAAVTANLELALRDIDGLAESTELPAELHDELYDAREAAERLRAVTSDLRLFSRSEEEHTTAVDVHEVLDSSVRIAWNEIRHRAQLEKDYSDVPLVGANESRLGQVFLNLLVNAAQAIPAGRAEANAIRVATRHGSDATVAVEITDTGSGMTPEVQERLFEPFFTSKSAGVGTGLGLAIGQRIVTDLGGEIEVASDVGEGATFRVSLPVAQQSAPEAETASEAAVASRSGRILVIDDEPPIGRTIERLLGRDHDVVTTTSAREALDWLSDGERFDVILCDLMMPVMTGIEFYEQLEQLLPDTVDRVIFLTGGTFTPKASAFLERCPNHHVTKPFDLDELRALVAAQLATECNA